MPIGRFLSHRVSIVRKVAVLDVSGNPTFDTYGQPIVVDSIVTGIAASIQPKSERERTAISQAGVSSSTHRIYLLPVDVTTADTIVHDASVCPMSPDLPDGTYEVVGVPSAAGQGHHLELDAVLVAAVQSAIA